MNRDPHPATPIEQASCCVKVGLLSNQNSVGSPLGKKTILCCAGSNISGCSASLRSPGWDGKWEWRERTGRWGSDKGKNLAGPDGGRGKGGWRTRGGDARESQLWSPVPGPGKGSSWQKGAQDGSALRGASWGWWQPEVRPSVDSARRLLTFGHLAVPGVTAHGCPRQL